MMRNEDENLKPKKNDELEKMMKQAAKGIDDNINKKKKENKKSTKKVVIFTSIGLVLFIATLIVGAILLKKPQEFEDKTASPDWVDNEGVVNIESPPLEVEYPIEVYEWAKEPYNQDTFWEEGMEKEILNVSKDDYRNFYFAISWMPSGLENEFNKGELDEPYTNDVSKRYIENEGKYEENPNFSYALVEDYEKAIVVHTQRLLNPTFGGWAEVQVPATEGREIKDDRQYNNLKDIFSQEWWNENIKEYEDYTNLPIMAEWNPGEWDKYNLAQKELIEQGMFYGQVNETEGNIIVAEIAGIDEEGQAVIDVTIPVKYVALGESGNNVEITGSLELTLESNQDSIDVRERIVISNAKLTLD